MLKKALICIVMLVVVFGCANQQKDTAEEPAEQTQEAEVDAAIEEISLTVSGMTWSVCEGAVQDALTKVTGVTEVVSVSHADSKAVVKVNKGEVKTEDLVQAVKEAGAAFTAKVVE